jgi:DivIVA domain-containing protein
MTVVSSLNPIGAIRSQEPWDRRNIAELTQTSFRTAMRGFDRDEVRRILDSVAADYRVLQLQNASLQRQLAHLEAVLQAYYRGDNHAKALPLKHLGADLVQRATDEARAILMRARAHTEETMASVSARARAVELPKQPDNTPSVAVLTTTRVERPTPTRTVSPRPSQLNRPETEVAIEVMLKGIDSALVRIPALPCE